jgi:uracil-DNA glycosylase
VEPFTDAAIQNLRWEKLLFFFTLGNLHIKGLKIDRSKHLVLESGHPSPMSANQGNGLEQAFQ